jgi:hypothetical protein
MCDLWWTKWLWDGFFSELFGFPRQYNSTVAVHTHISPGGGGVNSRPFGGRSSETQPHPVDMINKSHSSAINFLLCMYMTGICVEGLKRHFGRDFRSPGSSPGGVPESVQPSSGTVAAPSGPVSCPQPLQFITIVQFDGM